MTWIEAIGVVFGLICVWLTVRQNIWCWSTGLVQVALYILIFYCVKLYSDLVLHVSTLFFKPMDGITGFMAAGTTGN